MKHSNMIKSRLLFKIRPCVSKQTNGDGNSCNCASLHGNNESSRQHVAMMYHQYIMGSSFNIQTHFLVLLKVGNNIIIQCFLQSCDVRLCQSYSLNNRLGWELITVLGSIYPIWLTFLWSSHNRSPAHVLTIATTHLLYSLAKCQTYLLVVLGAIRMDRALCLYQLHLRSSSNIHVLIGGYCRFQRASSTSVSNKLHCPICLRPQGSLWRFFHDLNFRVQVCVCMCL